MKSFDWQEYSGLQSDRLPRSPWKDMLASAQDTLGQFCQALFRGVVHYLSRPDDVRVWQVKNPDGSVSWRAYDRYSNTTSYLNSEEDLRSWLEQRYYMH
jgi:hypothetical protein